jgi:hypothetical protein
VDGRSQEVIVMRNGQRMTALFIPHLMKEFSWIDGYQVAQTEPGVIEMRLVTPSPLSPRQTQPIETLLRSKLGAATSITFRRVESLQKNPSGKTPIVVAAEEE